MLVRDLLSDLLRKEVLCGNFQLHHGCKDPEITHLAFADDLTVFLNGHRRKSECFRRVL